MNQEEILSTLEEAKLSEKESTAFFDALIQAGVHFTETQEDEEVIDDLNYETDRQVKLIDPVKQYLAQIGEIALLDFTMETSLATVIRQGQDAKNDIEQLMKDCAYQLSPQQVIQISELQKTVDAGTQAQNELVTANLRLVVSIAKKYAKFGVPLLDLIQEGNLGLIKAAEKFSIDKGCKFSTYATWWIRQAVTRFIADTSRTVRLPVHVSEELHKIRKATNKLNQYYERSASFEEIAVALNIGVEALILADQQGHEVSSKFVQALNHKADPKKKYSAQNIEDLLKAEIVPISLETPVGDDRDSTLQDFVEDQATPRPDAVVNNRELSIQIKKVLSSLTEKEERILSLRYGLEDGEEHTLDEIGSIIGVTRERIRQIEHKALKKLRNPERSKDLIEFYEGSLV